MFTFGAVSRFPLEALCDQESVSTLIAQQNRSSFGSTDAGEWRKGYLGCGWDTQIDRSIKYASLSNSLSAWHPQHHLHEI